MDELYTAERGGGAFMNDRRLRVAGRTKLSDAVIGTGVPHLGRGHHGEYLVELRNVMAEVSGIRRMGSAALDLAYVAAGRMDGFWEEPLAPWDVAAGILMVREAGGYASDKSGGQDIFGTSQIVAGNETIHRALLKTLKKPLSTR
jgi:myo-inositol-1(or 4)-monophosphatase